MEIDLTENAEELTDIAARDIREIGYSVINQAAYVSQHDVGDLLQFQASYFNLPADPDDESRFRAYGRILLRAGVYNHVEAQGYQQSVNYNYADGNRVRTFAPLDQKVSHSRFVQGLIKTDARIAEDCGIFSFDKVIRIGLHLVRYRPTFRNVSCSSPPGPHRDNEPIVFIHLVNRSANLIGGENAISMSPGKLEKLVQLENPFDTLCVTHRQFHSVVPHGIRSGTVGYRDILLVTFEPEESAL